MGVDLGAKRDLRDRDPLSDIATRQGLVTFSDHPPGPAAARHTGAISRSGGGIGGLEAEHVVKLVCAGVLAAVGAVLVAAGGWLSGVVLLLGAAALVAVVYRAY
jgi:hypothetical protein